MAATRSSKFQDFERKDYVYRTIEDHQLHASVLIPKGIPEPQSVTEQPPHTAPVLVFWHGGGWIVGSRLYEPWWSTWLIELARSHDAIIVTADFRLLPEATGSDIADDIDAFWTWLHGDLVIVSDTEAWRLRPDLGNILCVGQSTGGVMAVHSALVRPDVRIKAIVSLYAPLYDNIPDFTVPRPRAIMGSMPPPPRQAESKIRAYMKRTRASVRSSGDPACMWDLLTSILQQGWLPRLIYAKADDKRMYTLRLLEEAGTMPPVWIIHGEQDSVVSRIPM